MRSLRFAPVIVLALHGCTATPEVTAPALERTPTLGPELDLGAFADRARLAFRADGEQHLASSPLLHVLATTDGSVRIAASDGAREGRLRLRTLGLTEAHVQVASDGALERSARGLTEVFRMRDDALMQSWKIPVRPEGDLVVRVAVEGASFVGRTEGGLHFRGAADLGFSYGHGTLIDADGRGVHIPATWSGEAIELRVPEYVLARAIFPAVLDPIITPEAELDAPIRVPHSTATTPVTAFDGTHFWVAWYDFGRPDGAIRVARVASDGTLVDPDGIVVHAASSSGPSDLVLATDQLFLGWSESAGGTYRARVKRIALDGTVLDAAPIDLDYASNLHSVRVASDGTDVVVTYTSNYSYPRAVRVSRAGVALDATPIAMPDFVDDVAFANGRYVMVHGWGTQIRAWRVAVGGSLIDAAPISVAAPAGAGVVRLAESGPGLVMAWYEGSTTTSGVWTHTSIAACRLDDDAMLGTSSPVSFAGPIGFRNDLGVSSDGTRTWVTWAERPSATSGYQSYAVRLSPAGALLDATPLPLASGVGAQRSPSVAPSPAANLVVWATEAPSPRFVEARRIDDTGAWIDVTEMAVATASNPERGPASAFGRGVHLVAWTDRRSPASQGSDVYAVRVANDGTILDAPAFAVASSERTERVTDVVFDGTNFLVLYDYDDPTTGNDIYARRVAPDGSLPDAAPLVLQAASMSQSAARAAFDGSQHLVVWLDNRAGTGTGLQVWAARFAPDGTPVGAPSVLYTPLRAQSVDAAYGDGVFFAGWYHRVPASTATANWAVRIASDGTVLDATPLTLPGDQGLVLTDAPTGALALGTRQTSSAVDFYATVLRGTGSPSAPWPYARTVPYGSGRWLAATWTGSRYYAIAYEIDGTVRRVLGVALDGGATLDPAEGLFEIMPIGDGHGGGDATSAGDGRALYAYSRMVAEAPYGADRARARWIGDPLAVNGSACTDTMQCASGFCVDGVCCDGACGGGDPADCQACSILAGAAADGECAPRDAAVVCRPSRGECDREESCDGTSVDCPPDARLDAAVVCRASRGDCDAEERCDGVGDACPADALRTSDEVCRAAAGDCDVEERCDGVAPACPTDALRSSEETCRVRAGPCDLEERCDGTSVACPSDAVAPDGAACGSGSVCSPESCRAGECASGASLDCDDGDACTADVCEEPTGCRHDIVPGCRDAGVVPPPPPTGCGCGATGEPRGLGPLMVLVLAALVCRRVRRRPIT